MTACIIDGKAIAAEVRAEVAGQAAALRQSHGRAPGLGVILVGDDPASHAYVRMKHRACDEAGFHSVEHRYPAEVDPAEVLARIAAYNADPLIDGILVQLPLPKQFDTDAVLFAIDPTKDVDGFHPVNVGRLSQGQETFVPCTPLGVQVLLQRSGIETKGRLAVILGRSNIVGKPMAQLLMQKGPGGDATVCVCHSRSSQLREMCRQADILIAAIGLPGFVKADMVKPGAAVIDVGINRVEDTAAPRGYRLVGDGVFRVVRKKIVPNEKKTLHGRNLVCDRVARLGAFDDGQQEARGVGALVCRVALGLEPHSGWKKPFGRAGVSLSG